MTGGSSRKSGMRGIKDPYSGPDTGHRFDRKRVKRCTDPPGNVGSPLSNRKGVIG